MTRQPWLWAILFLSVACAASRQTARRDAEPEELVFPAKDELEQLAQAPAPEPTEAMDALAVERWELAAPPTAPPA